MSLCVYFCRCSQARIKKNSAGAKSVASLKAARLQTSATAETLHLRNRKGASKPILRNWKHNSYSGLLPSEDRFISGKKKQQKKNPETLLQTLPPRSGMTVPISLEGRRKQKLLLPSSLAQIPIQIPALQRRKVSKMLFRTQETAAAESIDSLLASRQRATDTLFSLCAASEPNCLWPVDIGEPGFLLCWTVCLPNSLPKMVHSMRWFVFTYFSYRTARS